MKKSWVNIDKSTLAVAALSLVLISVLCTGSGFPYDVQSLGWWANHIHNNGIGNAYGEPTNNYPPLINYFLWFYNLLFRATGDFKWFKSIVLLVEFVGAFMILSTIENRQKHLLLFCLLIFNISFLYDNILWGQTDGILTTFLFGSLIFAQRKHITISLCFYILAFNFKFQAGVLFPVLALVLLPNMMEKFSFKNLLKWIVVPALLQLLILLPFILTYQLEKVWIVFTESFSKYEYITMNAYNFWTILFHKNEVAWIPDTTAIFGITYKQIGLFLFCISSFFALQPLMKEALKKVRNKANDFNNLDRMLLAASLVFMLFFFFPTEMHERYSYPAIYFIAAWSFRNRRYLPYIIFSGAFFLNMERVLTYLKLENYLIAPFSIWVVAGLYFLLIVILFIEIYKKPKLLNSEMQ
ncbi:MAG: hypothetical protein NTX03_02320 [Bacteroidetes bacterium]|nr:hypothetical protein [Bacteroidota bacterium]